MTAIFQPKPEAVNPLDPFNIMPTRQELQITKAEEKKIMMTPLDFAALGATLFVGLGIAAGGALMAFIAAKAIPGPP